MATVYLQSWIEDDEGYIRHDGWRVYTTKAKAVEETDRLEREMNSPKCRSSVWRDGQPFAHDVSDAVYNRAKEREGFSVEFLSELEPKN